MTRHFSAIVGVHTNPFTCGIARFNARLAEQFRIAVLPWSDFVEYPASDALLSIKVSEFDTAATSELDRFVRSGIQFDLFLHAFDDTPIEQLLVQSARHLFVGSNEMARLIGDLRSDVIACFAPGMEPLPVSDQSEIRLLTFGMAHKISSNGYRKLADLLRLDGRSSTLEISSALHEGTKFDSEFFAVADEIRSAFDGSVRFLGFLADEEVSERLRRATAMVAFFPRGVRENNTSVMGALAHGCPVITNLDSDSPKWLQHGVTCIDVSRLTRFPPIEELAAIGIAGQEAISEYTYESLAEILRG
jgi:hypothetical protein